MKIFFILSSILFSATVYAGSESLICHTKENDIRYSGGNAANMIEIDYTDSQTKQKGTYEVPVLALPYYNYGSVGGGDAIMSLPTSEKKYSSKKCARVHVIHADGSECYGRESWEIIYLQTFVLAGKNGRSLDEANVLLDRNVQGKISDGYIVREFECKDEGVTSPGGCFVQKDDKVAEEVEFDCAEMGY